MRPEIVSILVLVAMFVVATVFPINLGAVGFVAALAVGMLALGMDEEAALAGFPADLFLILVGLTYLFAIAQRNGTVDLLVRWSLRAVRGRLAAAPWIFFVLSALFSAIGALFAVAIVAPVAMPFARRYGIDRLLMGAMVVHGALGGAFSPISVYGTFVNGVVGGTELPSSPTTLFLAPLAVNIVVAVVVFLALGGRSLAGSQVSTSPHTAVDETAPHEPALQSGQAGPPAHTHGRPAATAGEAPADGQDQDHDQDGATAGPLGVTGPQALTLAGIVVLAVGTVAFGIDVGVLSMSIAVVLGVLVPRGHAEALKGISWSTVLLVCGVITYVTVLQEAGTTAWVGDGIVALGVPLLAALLLCYLGGVLSAFASSVGILGVAIPLALPFLEQGAVDPIGMVAALAVASTIVDVSPFSTNGALTLAAAHEQDREALYRRMLVYSAIVVATGPLLGWAALVAVPTLVGG